MLNLKIAHNFKMAGFSTIIANPLNPENVEPKLPDGRSALSSGFKQTVVVPMKIASDSPTDVINIVLYPGLVSGVAIKGADCEGKASAKTPPTYHDTAGWMYSTPFLLEPVSSSPDPDRTGTTHKVTQGDNNRRLARWRLVSQAMRVTVLNNSDNDDGWFEAIRFSPSEGNDFNWHRPEAGAMITETNGGLLPGSSFFGTSSLTTTQMCQMPSYQTGRLRDLNKLLFPLNRVEMEAEFKEVQSTYGVSLNTGGTDVLNYDSIYDDTFDNSFDYILIRIHGKREPSEESCCRGTRLLLTAVANHEYVYSPGCTEARLMTKTSSYAATVAKVIKELSKHALPGIWTTTIDALVRQYGGAKRKR